MWHAPLPLKLVPTTSSESFKQMPRGHTGLPLRPHPGAFAVKRKHHIHEGIDLYAPVGTPVFAVETGEVKSVRQFTGPELGHDWWLPTWAVWVEGASGVVVYGELEPRVHVGDHIRAGDCVGAIVPVLKTNKGRPTSMLHLELRTPNAMQDIDWHADSRMPDGLLDPTQFLLDIC
jgi:murein DD-endopeptidase MepM/ murein hydrolase activator NlpD